MRIGRSVRRPEPAPVDPVGLGHRFGPVRGGPILPPRPIDAIPPRPVATELRRVVATGPPLRTERDCRLAAERAGWSVAAIRAGPDRRTNVVVERAIRMDLTALGRTRRLLLAFTAEFVAAILLGFGWTDLGFATWEGELLIALGVVGAAGFVVMLPRVEFVSEVGVWRLARNPAATESTVVGASPHDPPAYELWAATARSRNWEVLGDRGGRRILSLWSSPDADEAIRRLADVLRGPMPSVEPARRSTGYN